MNGLLGGIVAQTLPAAEVSPGATAVKPWGSILLSLLRAHYVHLGWLWFTAFVGLNLFQSAVTHWCLMMRILQKLGIPKQ